MGRRQGRYTNDEIADLVDSGVRTLASIAREEGVSTSAISQRLKKLGRAVTDRAKLAPYWPWPDLVEADLRAEVYKRTRNHVRWRVVGSLPEGEAARYASWIRGRIQALNAVVVHDADAPPTPGLIETGRWRYEDRTPEDGNLLIRVEDPSWWTEERRRIWALPEHLPGSD